MGNPIILAALLAVGPASTVLAAPPDDAWLAWVGCWRAEGDTSERSLCIVPEGDGVRMVTLNAGRIETESRIVADGVPRKVSQEGCSGTETAQWSADRQRLFLNAELNCGNSVTRRVSGIFAMLGTNQWSSVQSIGTAGTERMHTVRYLEATPPDLTDDLAAAFKDNRLARETVRLAAAAQLQLADVIEAVRHVDARAVEGWLTTVGQEFNLDAAKLIALSDAGVPPSVIDVLVAVSNPGRFAVREERANQFDPRRGRRLGGCYDSYWRDPYDPFAYSGYHNYGCRGGFVGGGYWGGGTIIVIDRGETRTRGRVTKDGYKSPRRDDEAGSVTATVPSKTSPARSSGSDAGSSSGSDSGRKAKPRDN